MYIYIKFIFSLIVGFIISNVVMSQHYKVMSYNIRYDNNWDKAHDWQNRKASVVQIFKQFKPNIFGIQEGLLNQVKYIDENLKNYKYIGVGRDNGKTKGEYSALFYNFKKFELIKNGTFWLSKTPNKPSKGWDAALNRICTYGFFKNLKTKEKFWVFNTHFDHKGELARLNSAKLLLSKIRDLRKNKYPVVLMGDFNDTSDKEPIKILSNGLIDAMSISKNPLNGPTGTFNNFTDANPIKRIDYFFTDKIKVFSYMHINIKMNKTQFPSDHFPIFMRFDLVY